MQKHSPSRNVKRHRKMIIALVTGIFVLWGAIVYGQASLPLVYQMPPKAIADLVWLSTEF